MRYVLAVLRGDGLTVVGYKGVIGRSDADQWLADFVQLVGVFAGFVVVVEARVAKERSCEMHVNL